LTRDGVIVFSNNFRRFKLDRAELEQRFEIEDWSAHSIPFDFARRADIHGCWLLRRRIPDPGVNPWDSARIKK
jgi:23S rRNA (guanine2445-N2)-methyltransferase / 23S rRNA (guanine2069-N7)-methyltransferase